MSYIGIPDDTIKKLAIEAMRHEEGDTKFEKKKFINFNHKALPKGSKKLESWLENYNALTTEQKNSIDSLLTYLTSRGIGADWYDFMYSDDTYWDTNKRVLIPFYWRGNVVGCTGRMFERSDKVKYFTDVQPGYVFNMDAQDWTRKFVIVTEGQLDAIFTDGVAIGSNNINDDQANIIDSLNKRVIVLPDADSAGMKMVNKAVDRGWGVAFPDWDNCKDAADAAMKYGRLYTLRSILDSVVTNTTKIKVLAKGYCK